MKVLLTSCGLETKGITNKFMDYIAQKAQKPSEIKALLIPTAAVTADAIEVLPKCLHDLLKCGVRKENICIYDLHVPMTQRNLDSFDVVYLCGGDPAYLLGRMREQHFQDVLLEFIKRDGILVGVSAGSILFAGNLKGNLGLLKSKLAVHCGERDCEKAGVLDASKSVIQLGNQQAIVFDGNNRAVILE